jgi:hypothetical protein
MKVKRNAKPKPRRSILKIRNRIHPLLQWFMRVAGHPHKEQEEQHSLLFGGNIDENFYGKPGYDR